MRPNCDENSFEDALIALAVHYGWRCHAERRARTADGNVITAIKGHRGYPDVTLVHPTHGIIFAELKSAKGRMGPGQPEWIADLAHYDKPGSPVLVEIWRPADWEWIELCLRDGLDTYRQHCRNVSPPLLQ